MKTRSTMSHTIVFFQPGKMESRTYWDFESLNDALECKCLCFCFVSEIDSQFSPNRHLPHVRAASEGGQPDSIDNHLWHIAIVWLHWPTHRPLLHGVCLLCVSFLFDILSFFLLHRLQRSTNMYAPFPKDWIKEKIFIFLKREASRPN